MNRNIITVSENGTVHIPDGGIWMSEPELVGLFRVIAPMLRAAVKAVYRSGVCHIGCDRAMFVRTHGGRDECYSLRMVTALAFRINTPQARIVRNALLERMTRQRKEEKTIVFLSLRAGGMLRGC
jgi:hypothetical protein